MKNLILALASVAALIAEQPAAKPEHYMQFLTQAGAFPSSVTPAAGPHVPAPIGLNAPNCRIWPFYATGWLPVTNSLYACYPWQTTATSPATSAYLARWNFQVNIFGPCNPADKPAGEGPETTCTVTQTNGYQYISYCTDTIAVTWSSYTGSGVNPASGKVEPAFVIAASAYSPILESVTMTGTQYTFWDGASDLQCNPTSCTAPCN